jgi:hypothetical protein
MMHAPPPGSMYSMHPPAPPGGVPPHLTQSLQANENDNNDNNDNNDGDNNTASASQKRQRQVLLDPNTHHPIQSVADWQKATLASGKVPSTNRCVALKPPVPSRFWG